MGKKKYGTVRIKEREVEERKNRQAKRDSGKSFLSKKWLYMNVCMLSIFITLSVIASAQAATTMVSISEITRPSGADATLPITIASVEEYGTGTISITYDPSVVHVTNVSDGLESTVAAWNVDNTTGVAKISAWNLAGVSGEVVFANVDFKVVGSAGRSTPLELNVTTFADTTYKDILVSVTHGTFNIEGDGIITTPTSTPTVATTSTSTPTSATTPTSPATSAPILSPSPSPTLTPTIAPTTAPASTVSQTSTPTETGEAKATQASEEKTPGFGTIFACVALLITYVLLMRKQRGR